MTVDHDKVRSKLQFLRGALQRLEEIRDRGAETFLSEQILQDAAVRNLQVGIEAMLDVANHIVAYENLGVPGTYRQSLEILLQNQILPADHGPAFLRMVGFRNRAVHLYDSLDSEEILEILNHDLGDFEAFLGAIARRYLPS